jgi:signal transduction histidine kinase
MLANSASPPAIKKVLLLAVIFGVLGYLGNLIRLPLGFNLAFIFGSISTLICTVLLGWRFGLLSTLIASIYTYFLWNHPYAIAILGAETLWVSLALRRGHRDLLLIDTLFWSVLGVPLVFLFYGSVQHLGLQTVTATALKQAVNGVLNALVASTLLRYLPLKTWLGFSARSKRYPLGAVIFDISLLLLLVPSVAMLIAANRTQILQGEQKVAAELTTEAIYREGVLRSWADHQLLAITRVAALGQKAGRVPPARLQEDLRQIHALTPAFRNLFLSDGHARSVVFEPPINEWGDSNIGLDFSDHPYAQQVKATMKPVISGVFFGSKAAFRPIFTISVPRVEEGQFRGFGSGAVNLADLQAVLTQTQGEHSPLLTLLDPQDQVVISTDPALHTLGTISDPPGTRIQRITDQVFLHIPPTHKNISVMDTWRLARYTIRIPVRDTPWALVITRPAGPLQERAFILVIWTLTGLAGLFLLVLLVALLVSRSLSRASVRLAAFSRDLPARIETGEDLVWPETRFEEIALMTDHFRATSEALGERLRQLKTETGRRMATERAMIHQSRLAAMGEMIGHIAHQWRQPLNSLSMLLANLRDAYHHRDLDPESLEHSFSKGEALIQQMSSTISDFGNFFRPDKELTTFSALRQIQSAVGLVEASFRTAGIAIQVDTAADVALFGIPNEYSQVLLNLLSNAKQAIGAMPTDGGEIRIHLSATGGFGCLTVSDTGGGIPEELLDRIFEPYFSTHASGTGIGLYMSRQIIEESMGGRISARNIEGGAEFTVCVPVAGEGR